MSDFIPHSDDTRKSWNKNMKAKIAVQGTATGLTLAETTQMAATSDSIITSIETSEDAHVTAKTATATKDAIILKGEKEQRAFIKRIKSNPNYTVAIGEDLQIVVETPLPKNNEVKPVIKVEVRPSKVVISFVKGKLDGMDIYERLAGNTVWTKLAYNSYSPYEDKRPLAVAGVSEHREYMGIGVVHDEEVTLQSDIMEAIFGG